MSLESKEKGDKVYLDCYTSMGASSAGVREVHDTAFRFDHITGEKFKILKVDSEWYDSRNGGCYQNNGWMYYIEDFKQ